MRQHSCGEQIEIEAKLNSLLSFSGCSSCIAMNWLLDWNQRCGKDLKTLWIRKSGKQMRGKARSSKQISTRPTKSIDVYYAKVQIFLPLARMLCNFTSAIILSSHMAHPHSSSQRRPINLESNQLCFTLNIKNKLIWSCWTKTEYVLYHK